MRRAAALLVALALPAASPAAAKAKAAKTPPPPAPATTVEAVVTRVADGSRADLTFDGPLLGWALPRTEDGRRTLYALVGPKPEAGSAAPAASCAVRDKPDEPAPDARLYRWRPDAPDKLEQIASALPRGTLESADTNDDGDEELVLAHEGGFEYLTIGADGHTQITPLVKEPELGTICCGPRLAWDAPAAQDRLLRVSLPGLFRTYGPGPGSGIAITSEIEIPKRVRLWSDGMSVGTPAVRPIGKNAKRRMLFATDPEPLGKRRLRTLLLDPDGYSDNYVVESWALFPGPESLVDSAFAMLNGAPVMIVTTTTAEKLSLLGEKALRVYPLGGDRTRAGDQPILAATTGINLWQPTFPAVFDLDADGHDDLVLAYWKGLQNSIAALEVYKGGTSGFAKARTMSFDVDEGEKAFLQFGPDLDGDGRRDLVLFAKREMLVFPGSPADRAAGKPVATKPSRRIPLAPDIPRPRYGMSIGLEGFQVSREWGGLGAPHFVDLDGDRHPEAVLAGDGPNGGRVEVVFVRESAPLAPSATISGK